jgi:hypothetical protein
MGIFSLKVFQDCCFNDLVEIMDGLRHTKAEHCPKGQVKSVLLSEEVDATKDEVKPKIKFFLAGIVKGGNEGLIEGKFLYVVHEDIKVVQDFNNVPPLIGQILQMSDPAVQIRGLPQIIYIDAILLEMFSELHVDQPKKVLLFGGKSAVDINVASSCIIQELMDESSLSGGFLPIDKK